MSANFCQTREENSWMLISEIVRELLDSISETRGEFLDREKNHGQYLRDGKGISGQHIRDWKRISGQTRSSLDSKLERSGQNVLKTE